MKKTQNTKKEKNLIDNYFSAKMHSINELYKNASIYKHRAERLILDEMKVSGGFDYKVIGGNCMQFSCGYLLGNDDGIHLIYHTARRKYNILIIE